MASKAKKTAPAAASGSNLNANQIRRLRGFEAQLNKFSQQLNTISAAYAQFWQGLGGTAVTRPAAQAQTNARSRSSGRTKPRTMAAGQSLPSD